MEVLDNFELSDSVSIEKVCSLGTGVEFTSEDGAAEVDKTGLATGMLCELDSLNVSLTVSESLSVSGDDV